MRFIKNLGELTKNDVDFAGGKGVALGELIKAGFFVPDGFVVLTNAFEQFFEDAGLDVEIDLILRVLKKKNGGINKIESAAEKIQVLIQKVKMPKEVSAEICRVFEKLGLNHVAVRSSATVEDGATASWAGQFESYLNIGKKDLLESVKRCWASLFTVRAIFYRVENGFWDKKIKMAVVVQKMVKSEVSGVAFSVCPVIQDYNRVIIEAGDGFGDKIVSGNVTPDNYVFGKSENRILSKSVDKPKLSDREICDFSKIILKIEDYFGFPVDVEWARGGGVFYILQSRPITTLFLKNKEKMIYKKLFQRSIWLLDCQYWFDGEKEVLPKLCGEKLFFEPLFVYRAGEGVSIYYNYSDFGQDPENLIKCLGENEEIIGDFEGDFENARENLIGFSRKAETGNFGELYKLFVEFWGYLSLVMVLAEEKNEKIRVLSRRAYELRVKYDAVVYDAVGALREMVKKRVPAFAHGYLQFLMFEEIDFGRVPSVDELKKRSEGYILYKNEFFLGCDLKKFADEHDFEILEDENVAKGEIVGVSACLGKVFGKVKVVFENAQMWKVKKGDILVAAMTVPDFLPAMMKAAAIVTDEGGITCHAAIVAREMGKPCIIGTKIATRVLKDGDLIEVDADRGVVRVLN